MRLVPRVRDTVLGWAIGLKNTIPGMYRSKTIRYISLRMTNSYEKQKLKNVIFFQQGIDGSR